MKYLQDKLYKQVDDKMFVMEEGLRLVKEWLKKELEEEDLEKHVRLWEELETCEP